MKRSFIKDPYLKLWLPLYELDGNSFMSKDIYGHLCVATGTTWGIQGRTFAGGDDYVNLGTTTSDWMDFTTQDFTVALWLNPSSLPAVARIIIKGNANVTGWTIYLATTDIYFATHDGNPHNNTQVHGMSIGTWYQFTHTYNASATTSQWYKNGATLGAADTTIPNPSSAVGTSGLIGINTDLTGYPYYGTIGEVLIYSRALTAVEIQNLYLTTKDRYQ